MKRLRWHWRQPRSGSWRVDETYVKVRGKWAYLYRAVDKQGNTIDFYFSPTRNTMAAKRFLAKALTGLKDWEQPEVINTDKAPTYATALAELKAEGKFPKDTQHRQVKYLNNIIEADHGKLKQLIRPVRGFKSMKTAYATIKGFEVMRALRKGQAAIFNLAAAAGQHRTLRVGADDLDLGIAFLEVAGGTGEGAAGADAGHESGQPAFGLLPDLRPGGAVVDLGIGQIGELVGPPRSGNLACQTVGHAIVAVGRVGRHLRWSSPRPRPHSP